MVEEALVKYGVIPQQNEKHDTHGRTYSSIKFNFHKVKIKLFPICYSPVSCRYLQYNYVAKLDSLCSFNVCVMDQLTCESDCAVTFRTVKAAVSNKLSAVLYGTDKELHITNTFNRK
jgi:hypothetical protein